MNVTAWLSGPMATFKALLRVPVEGDGAEPAGETGLAAARAARKAEIGALADELAYLLFDSNTQWFDQDDASLAGYLNAWLSAEQDTSLRTALNSGDEAGLTAVVDWLTRWLPGWKQQAEAEIAAATAEGGATADGELVGVENPNWQQDRMPGTRYYTYHDEEYLYADSQRAPAAAWKPMAERQRAATEAARPWGESWFSTPTGQAAGSQPYGGEYVFARSADGPWVTLAEAQAKAKADTSPDGSTAPSFEDLQKMAVEAAQQAGLLNTVSAEQWLAHVDSLIRIEYAERTKGAEAAD